MDNLSWISKEALDKWQKDFQSYLLWGPPPDTRTEEQKYLDTLKMAYITLDGKQVPAKVSTKDGKAYELDDFYYQTALPLEEIKDFLFVRWWTTWDF